MSEKAIHSQKQVNVYKCAGMADYEWGDSLEGSHPTRNQPSLHTCTRVSLNSDYFLWSLSANKFTRLYTRLILYEKKILRTNNLGSRRGVYVHSGTWYVRVALVYEL